MISAEPAVVSAAFTYGIPLTFNLDHVQRYVKDGNGANPPAAFNTFSHARTLAGPEDTLVSINNDTIYSMAQLDLGVGPLLLEVPDTGGRYYVLQFVDAWTNNFAYVGHRATGTAVGTFLIAPPGWEGLAPAGATVITSPTRIASIVGRWACDGDADLPAVHRLQDATTLSQLDPAAIPAGIPAADPAIPAGLLFLEKLRLWSQEFPPAERDRPALAALAAVGVCETGPSPYLGLDAATAGELGAATGAARQALGEFLRNGEIPMVNGWQLAYHSFDYNEDFFEVGTLNEPLYTSMEPRLRYTLRAAAALGGLWGNHGYEAAYASVYLDADGGELTGASSYELHLDPTPPVGAFWSLTMYSAPDFLLVPNPIDRYSIGDRTPGLIPEADGSLKLHISAIAPADAARHTNWLPAPAGNFRPLLRMYEPDASVIDGGYKIPAIRRIEGA